MISLELKRVWASIYFCDKDEKFNKLAIETVPRVNNLSYSKDFNIDEIFADIISTASNPNFTFGGGLDAYLQKRFGLKDAEKYTVVKGDHKIWQVFFNITCDENIKSDKWLVLEAYRRYFAYCREHELKNIVVTGFGCGIAGVSREDAVAMLSLAIDLELSADNHYGMRVANFFKFIGPYMSNRNIQYKLGLNCDTKHQFASEGSCVPGGLYFARKDFLDFAKPGFLARVTIPFDAKIVKDPGTSVEKWRADKIFIEEVMPV